MKKRLWYYLSIVGILFSLGAIAYSIISGETVMIGKFLLVLGLSIYFFIRERKGKQEQTSKLE